ncbi:MAG: hypothetical protein K6D95_09705 [Treponema sp.]|nr:hypothetical protein [Treponema sp.]
MSDFSVLNESSLHNYLKLYYARKFNAKTEVELYGHIYDVLTEDKEVYEIQTQNLSKLRRKIEDTLEKGLKITLVYPLVVKRKIAKITRDNKEKSLRTSPVKGSIYDIFKEITGIYDLLLRPGFKLEVLYVNITEERIITEEAVQSKNRQRRYRKNWLKANKRLDEITERKIFSCKGDYLSLLPPGLEEEFSAKDIKEALKEDKLAPARIYNNSNLIVWVLNKMGLIIQTKTEKRSRFYKIA